MKRAYITMCVLVVLFVAPGMLAYMVYLHPTWISAKTNHGQLLQPPPLLHSKYRGEKWQLLYWSPQDCTQDCEYHLDDLARMRLALGRRLYYVDLLLAMPNSAVELPERTRNLLHKMDGRLINLTQEDTTELGSQPAIYLVNPQHFVILSYKKDQSMHDIFEDLQKMVRDK